MKSYTSTRLGFWARLSEFRHLYRYQTRSIPEQVRTLIERLRTAEQDVYSSTDVGGGGIRFQSLKMLEIGPGQRFRQMSYFSRFNDIVGIDLDELVQDWSVRKYAAMLRQNGLIRTAKTLGRHLLGIDAAFESEMTRQLGKPRPATLDLRRMDATKMDFPDATFDFVYSYSVLEHIPDCRPVLSEVARVLRPGGAAYLSLHLYTSDDGCHDPRIFSGKRGSLPLWPHLRPAWAGKVRPNAYLNRLRLAQWDALFNEMLPGVTFKRLQYGANRLHPLLQQIRALGELSDYTDDELLTSDYVAIWKKPITYHLPRAA